MFIRIDLPLDIDGEAANICGHHDGQIQPLQYAYHVCVCVKIVFCPVFFYDPVTIRTTTHIKRRRRRDPVALRVCVCVTNHKFPVVAAQRD